MSLSRLSNEDKNTLYGLNIKVPKECTTTGEEDKLLSEGFSKPTTLVTKKGKVIGCIKGYYDFDTYLNKLDAIMEG